MGKHTYFNIFKSRKDFYSQIQLFYFFQLFAVFETKILIYF